jgi:hypothetical protein
VPLRRAFPPQGLHLGNPPIMLIEQSAGEVHCPARAVEADRVGLNAWPADKSKVHSVADDGELHRLGDFTDSVFVGRHFRLSPEFTEWTWENATPRTFGNDSRCLTNSSSAAPLYWGLA